jgi:hypothetical protein
VDFGNSNWKSEGFCVDWTVSEESDSSSSSKFQFDPEQYRSSMEYDALGRVKSILYPQDVSKKRRHLNLWHNRAGLLERVDLDDKDYVK